MRNKRCGMFLLFLLAACGGGDPLAVAPATPPPEVAPSSPPVAPPAVVEPSGAAPLPGPADADGDGVPDASDNCPDTTNADQRNTDAADELVAVGDACDPDDDGDGLPDTEELTLGKDMRVTDPLTPDTDADGVIDGVDNCPTEANAKQRDQDADGFGDDDAGTGTQACDCNDADPAIHPLATDLPDIAALDRNCDRIDGDRERAIFAAPSGDDGHVGTLTAPVHTLARGVALAAAQGKALYLLEGEYTPERLVWPAAIQIYGGFATTQPDRPFGTRDPRAYPSTVVGSGPVAMTIAPPAQTVVLDGLHIQHEGSAPVARVLVIEGAAVQIRYSTIVGSAAADVAIGMEIGAQADARLEATWVDPGGLAGAATSTGVWVHDGEATLVNNVIRGGAGNQTEAVVIEQAQATLVHNTIDGGSTSPAAQTATAIRIADAVPTLVNNIVVTHAAQLDQYGVWCAAGSLATAEIRHNLFAVFPGTVYHPLIVDCDGTYLYDAADFTSIGAKVVDNYHYVGDTVDTLLVPADGYRFLGTGAAYPVDPAATGTYLADDVGTVRDWRGVVRAPAYLVGAWEE